MADTTFFLQAFGGFLALLIVVALLQWTFSGGKSSVFHLAKTTLHRPLTWLIIVVQILFVLWLSSGVVEAHCGAQPVCDSYAEMEAGLRLYLILFLWAVVNAVLGLIWVRKRTCPACGHSFKKSLPVCPACQDRRSYANRSRDDRGSF